MTKEIREIVVTEKYEDNIVWGSVDPIKGDIVLYPPHISLIIENGFKTRLIEDAFVYHKRRTDFKQFFKQLHFFGTARINIFRFFLPGKSKNKKS